MLEPRVPATEKRKSVTFADTRSVVTSERFYSKYGRKRQLFIATRESLRSVVSFWIVSRVLHIVAIHFPRYAIEFRRKKYRDESLDGELLSARVRNTTVNVRDTREQ